MTVAVLRSPLRKPYFVLGGAAVLLLAAAIATGLRAQSVLPGAYALAWSLATGLLLLGCIAFQWALFFSRLTGDRQGTARFYKPHRYVGALAVALFLLHAGSLGYALLTALALGFLAVSITGLLNAEVLLLTRPGWRRAWTLAHLVLSALLMPVIGLHVWAALAFK